MMHPTPEQIKSMLIHEAPTPVQEVVNHYRALLEENHELERGRAEFSSMYFRIREEQVVDHSKLQQTREELDFLRKEHQEITALRVRHDIMHSELEQVKAQRDNSFAAYKKRLEKYTSLRTELSAKDKVLEHFYGDESMYEFYGMGVQIMEDKGKTARSILSQYKGEPNEKN